MKGNSSVTDRIAWFTEARFGLFVHWGTYAVAGRHEWVKYYEKLPEAHYRKYFEQFRADRYDPRAWAAAARAAGMRYAVLTTKHHEGFCLWDTELTDYKSTNAPVGRDLVAEFVDAFRNEGLKVGFYYSLLDWHHPDFRIDGLHPRWDAAAGFEKLNAGRDMSRYVDYLHGQVRELVTRFDPDILWFDFSYADDRRAVIGKGRADWQAEKLVAMIRELSPEILLNDRLDYPESADFGTPEETAPHDLVPKPWEACRTMNGSWGYAPGYQQWMSPAQVVQVLVDGVSKGGNLLLNVGPNARGDLEPKARDLLRAVGEWTELHAESIYGAGPATGFAAPPDARLTRRGNRLYVHLFNWPAGHLVLDGLGDRVEFASFVHDGREVPMTVVGDDSRPGHMRVDGPDGGLILTLPMTRPDVLVPVIALDLA